MTGEVINELDEADVKAILEAKDKHACRYKAVANGLYLVKVWYGESEEDR